MKNKDLIKLEEAYSSVNNKQVIEEAPVPDTAIGDSLLLVITALLPIIFQRVLSLVPVLKNQADYILKLTKELETFITQPQGKQIVMTAIKGITNKKQTLDDQSNKKIEQKPNIADELTGGVRKKTPQGFRV